MAFKNNNNDDNPQNIKHCVLIDGDFGRHELFSNIHPYTLNRLDKLKDAFTFKTYTEKALKLMNDASNIHYHICYNSSLLEIDEYYKILKMIYPQSVWLHSSINTTTDNTLQIKEIISRHECDYIWIIHGIENHYEQLIERLKSNNNLKAKISSYCWLENLKDGSNRIEYLVK
jgi:hypothetical protein